MKKILLILVGGTICTALNENGTLSVSEGAGVCLKDNFENSDSPYAKKVHIDLTENLFILSENMTVENWNRMLDTYRSEVKKDIYAGVIFAHGTDTLAYSASLFSMILSSSEIPVFFVSANARLDSERSNGNANFKCAVECICRGIEPNVYVPYQNISDGKMYLHLASRVEQCKNYSDDFYSYDALDISDISEENYGEYFEKIKEKYPSSKRESMIDCFGNWSLEENILMITPYVGIHYDVYDYSRFKAVLHGSFHSGTACAQKDKYTENYGKNSVLYMIDQCAMLEPKVDTYFSPSKQSGEIYETVDIIGEHSLHGQKMQFLYGMTNEMAYTKLVLAYSVFKEEAERKQFIHTECNFEYFM